MDTSKLAVIGQGYVGLPLAMTAVRAGFDVVGIDLDARRVSALSRGESYVGDVSATEVVSALESGRYVVSDSYEAASGFDFAVITVPTPLRESLPDLSFIEESAKSLGTVLTDDATVILESTTYPGTTEELLVPLLESTSGLSAGRDFFVGYSPERVDPGNPEYGLKNTPKVVSGIDRKSLKRVVDFYSRLADQIVPVTSPKEAELTKLLENTFRHVNIALINEIAIFAHDLGIDVWEAIEAADTKPFGFMKFTPGPGVGGHCLPVDPSYLSWEVRRKLGANFRFVELANDVNDHMPRYVVDRLVRILNKEHKAVRDSKIVLFGLAYKRDTGDVRESPALRVAALLEDFGATVIGVDPLVEDHRWPDYIVRASQGDGIVRAADAVVILANHSVFDMDLVASLKCPILDTRACIPREKSNVERI